MGKIRELSYLRGRVVAVGEIKVNFFLISKIEIV